MQTKKTLKLWRVATLGAALIAASAAQAHGDAHDKPPKDAGRPSAPAYDPKQVTDTAFGRPGDPRKVRRTIQVDMSDTMRFSPSKLSVKRGDTVRIVARNKGQVLHELVLGTPAELKNHAEMMRRHPGMEHEDANMVHVKPGQSGEVVWQFTQAGEFQFACLIPGHFEAGMVGTVEVK